jgi:hypothetical protein
MQRSTAFPPRSLPTHRHGQRYLPPTIVLIRDPAKGIARPVEKVDGRSASGTGTRSRGSRDLLRYVDTKHPKNDRRPVRQWYVESGKGESGSGTTHEHECKAEKTCGKRSDSGRYQEPSDVQSDRRA